MKVHAKFTKASQVDSEETVLKSLITSADDNLNNVEIHKNHLV